jgi:S-DNA-T family DNA segregation ATPase FtsK/SpoIIIE
MVTRGPSPHQIRRTARRIRRYGIRPTMPVTSGHELGPTTGQLAVWWLWRYRSELAPLWLTLAAFTLAASLHASHPGWWPIPAGVTAATAVGFAVLGRHVGLASRLERSYAAAITALAGAWITAAAIVGPLRAPLPVVAVIAGTVAAIPWWAHRRRRAKVRIERKLDAWPEIASAIGLAGSRIQSIVIDVWGWHARLALARGQTIDDALNRIPVIESALDVHRGAARIAPTPDGKANRLDLRVLETDPHADAITWPGPSVNTITEPIDLGPFEDAYPARLLLLRRHALAGGVSGSGKSGGLNVLMGNLTACRDVVIWAIDLKRGMELRPWATCIDRLATTPAEARALLADAVTILEARADLLAATGQRVWEPTPDMPALVIIVDEYAELADDAPDATKDADSIARRGRAVAVTLIAATQRPTQKAMGKGALRSQMDVRICFRVRERKDVDLILGQGMLTSGWHAHTLNAPGKFLISAPEHDNPRRARAYLVTDQAVTATAERHAGIRPALDDISRQAIEGHHTGQRPDSRPAEPGHEPTREREDGSRSGPESILWAALSLAPLEGVTVPELIDQTSMSRPWIYQRLRDLVRNGQAAQVTRGRWHAVTSHSP